MIFRKDPTLEKGGTKMKKKKILALLVSAVMAVGVIGCGSGGSSSGGGSNEGGSDGDLIKVGIINNDPNESGYRTANDADMKEKFTKKNGYDASFYYSLKNDEQISAAQQFIQDGIDYLLISAADTAGWDTVLQDAQNAGTQVILFDRTIDADESLYVASIVSDMRAEGDTAVNWLKEQNLGEYNIIHIQGVMGSAAQVGRTAAMDEMAEAEGWTIVKQQAADWNAETAQQITQSVIDSGQDFNVIYAENDDMARGAVAALDAANISHGVDGDRRQIQAKGKGLALRRIVRVGGQGEGHLFPRGKRLQGLDGLTAGQYAVDGVLAVQAGQFVLGLDGDQHHHTLLLFRAGAGGVTRALLAGAGGQGGQAQGTDKGQGDESFVSGFHADTSPVKLYQSAWYSYPITGGRGNQGGRD